MPREGVTIYDLLISCPGDISEYLGLLKESVESFNRVFGALNNIEVVTKHWSTDSYPESGDKPQELLNKQLVRECDAAVAIFWTRFGTPTDKYGSGTEEEIEEMLLAGKQVFMYFLDAPINPSDVDMEQYSKVLNFRDKYKDRGIYAVVKDKHDFQRQFTNHLSLYFLPLISGEAHASNENLKPILKIRDINTTSDEYCTIKRNNLLESRFITEKKAEIIKNIEVLRKSILPKKEIEESNGMEDDKGNKSYTSTIPQIAKSGGEINSFRGISEYVIVDKNWKKTINDFANTNQIKLEDEFWNLGNLKSFDLKIQLPLPFGNSGPSYEGTDEEKNRYSLLENLYWNIKTFNEYNEYFGFIDNIKVTELMISNLGKTYDEDIDIKLIIPKDCLLKPHDLPYPGINIIEELSDVEFVDFVFSIEESETVSNYGHYPIEQPNFRHINNVYPFQGKSVAEEYEDNKRAYYNSLDSLFLYKEFQNSENDILVFDIKYLKHNSSMAFPSVLMFKSVPQTIEYEITSKHVPEVIKGKLDFKS